MRAWVGERMLEWKKEGRKGCHSEEKIIGLPYSSIRSHRAFRSELDESMVCSGVRTRREEPQLGLNEDTSVA